MTSLGQKKSSKKKLDQDFINLIDDLFLKLEMSYHYQFYKVFGDDERLKEGKKLWAMSLKRFENHHIKDAILKVVAKNDFLPTLSDFIKCCEEAKLSDFQEPNDDLDENFDRFDLDTLEKLRKKHHKQQTQQSQNGSTTFEQLKANCLKKAKYLNLDMEFFQSNIEGDIVTKIQEAKKNVDGIIINAAGFTHTSVAIRDALSIYKKPKIELHISNIYKREEFRRKSLISDVVTGGIFGLGSEGYILAIISMQKLLDNEN